MIFRKKIQFRKVTVKDANILLGWRNDKLTRKSSKNCGIISMKQHLKWLNTSLTNNNRKIFIVEYDGVSVGTIRTDYSKGVFELSWTIAPEARGKGIGKKMVALFAGQITDPIRAEIKEDNEVSKRAAEYAGMKFSYEKNGILYYVRTMIRNSNNKLKL